jgi:beta-N-acetylhexosaminidase
MELKTKASQLFICKNPDSLLYAEEFIKVGIGGFMVGKGGEIVSADQHELEGDSADSLKRFVDYLMALSKKHDKMPLFLAIDGEGGSYFNRLKGISEYKSARYYGLKYEGDNDLEAFRKEVESFAELMRSIGFNMNFAPLVDIARPGYEGYVAKEPVGIRKKGLTDSEVISSRRSYSDKKDTVIALALAAMKIFQEKGIIATIKHFPSYGILSVDENPHMLLPDKVSVIIDAELEPYREAIRQGCNGIMTGHIITSIDPDVPASLSAKAGKLLRENLGFKGLCVADELNMGAVKEFYGEEYLHKAPVDALNINDVILISRPETFIPMRDAVVDTAKDDREFSDRIDKAYERVIEFKRRIGLIG